MNFIHPTPLIRRRFQRVRCAWLIGLIALGCGETNQQSNPASSKTKSAKTTPPVTGPPLRIGIRMRDPHDIRLYRGQQTGAYVDNGVNVQFFSKGQEEGASLSSDSKNRDIFMKLKGAQASNLMIGKATQPELDAALANNDVDCISSGAVGFLEGVAKGLPRKAVITLGRTSKTHPSTQLLVRSDFQINRAKDWKQATVVFNRMTPFDQILLEELRQKVGVSASNINYKQVSVFREVGQALREGNIEMAFLPAQRSWRATMLINTLLDSGVFRLGDEELATLDSRGLNQQLLVCSNQFIEASKPALFGFLQAYKDLVKTDNWNQEAAPSSPPKTQKKTKGKGKGKGKAGKAKRSREKQQTPQWHFYAGTPVDTSRLDRLQKIMVKQGRLQIETATEPWVIDLADNGTPQTTTPDP